jgi:hypothetical protein
MRTLVLVLILQIVGTAGQESIEVVVPPGAATGTEENMRQLGMPKPKPEAVQPNRRGLAPVSFVEFLLPEEPLRFVVERYNPAAIPWRGVASWTPDSLKAELQAMLTARMEGMFWQVEWSEGYTWSVATTLTFKDGKQGKVLLDGLHGCYEDPDGYRWFFRYHLNRTGNN